jgi:uncharacterized membrane-anchored protein YitT (DUF2179 family)
MKRFGRGLLSFGLIVAGIFSAAFGLKGFLLSSHFIDGGVTGISMLLASILKAPLSVLILIINLPFIALGYRQIGRAFAIKSVLSIAGLSLCLQFVKFPDVTPDKLLTAVFGGFFIGAGIGLAIRGGAVLDGTEVAALIISRTSSLLNVGDVILLLNIVIFLTATFFLGVDSALYSILTYAAASRTIDFLLHGLEEYTSIIIISSQSEEIKQALINRLNRGVTVFKGAGGLGSSGVDQAEREILFCVVTRLEIGSVRNAVLEIDPNAFITTSSLSDVHGGLVKKPIFH